MQMFEKILEKLQECERQAEKDMGLSEKYAETNAYGGEMIAFEKAIEIVKQEAAECNNGWIPVSERLPDRNKPVLCWVRSTTIASGETYIIGSCDNEFWFLQTYEIGNHSFPVKYYEVIAWQPLPEPYQPKGE